MVDIDEESPIKYSHIIKNIYNEVVANIKSYNILSIESSITFRLHQGSTLRTFLFVIMIDGLTKTI